MYETVTSFQFDRWHDPKKYRLNDKSYSAIGETFQYVWRLLASLEGAESGSMDGKNTDKLKLSKVWIHTKRGKCKKKT